MGGINSESPRKIAEKVSRLIVDAFDDYNARFSDVTRRARRRFEARDRVGMHSDAVERIGLYDQAIHETFSRLEQLLDERLFSYRLWTHIRSVYGKEIESLLDAELYKTFFNTLTRRLFKTEGVDPAIEFVALDIEPTDRITHPVRRLHYSFLGDRVDAFRRLLQSLPFTANFADLQADARALSTRIQEDLHERGDSVPVAIELMETIFYRGGRAWLVGRIFGEHHYLPCVIALVNRSHGLVVDAVLTRHRHISVVFGYTHSYFHADLPTVGDAVVFLRTLLPHKPLDELYTVLGRVKQGKTERYRHFFRHLAESGAEKLEHAPGTAGMVMLVFTLPSYPLVFKVMRDDFGPAKPFGREHVQERYRMVFRHERGGRLIDAQEYRALRFPLEQVSETLLTDLLEQCGRTVSEDGRWLTVHHCYVERRVRPLDLFVAENSLPVLQEVVLDYGQAIKDLARSDIFPGDLLLKNFGVTRTVRVIFYDYDELRRVSECCFRPIPPPRSEVEELSAEPCYTVNPGDVFPEQFPAFMGLGPELMGLLRTQHPELFDYRWWQQLQQGIRRGELSDVPPYPESVRLRAVAEPS